MTKLFAACLVTALLVGPQVQHEAHAAPFCGFTGLPTCDGECAPETFPGFFVVCIDIGGACGCVPSLTSAPCGTALGVAGPPECYGECPPGEACVDTGSGCTCSFCTAAEPPGTPCPETDGNVCTVAGCAAGGALMCDQAYAAAPAGTPCPDTDGNPATTAGCNGAGACEQAYIVASSVPAGSGFGFGMLIATTMAWALWRRRE
jgi:hypothetical protein